MNNVHDLNRKPENDYVTRGEVNETFDKLKDELNRIFSDIFTMFQQQGEAIMSNTTTESQLDVELDTLATVVADVATEVQTLTAEVAAGNATPASLERLTALTTQLQGLVPAPAPATGGTDVPPTTGTDGGATSSGTDTSGTSTDAPTPGSTDTGTGSSTDSGTPSTDVNNDNAASS